MGCGARGSESSSLAFVWGRFKTSEELEDFFVGGDALVAEQLGPQTDLVFFDHQLTVDVDFELPDFAGD